MTRLLVILLLACAVTWATPSMSASPGTIDEFEEVTVTWSGISNPSDKDWLGVYSPHTATSPMIVHNITVPLPFGVETFQLLNMRYYSICDSSELLLCSFLISWSKFPDVP
jgi:hypothetical protein